MSNNNRLRKAAIAAVYKATKVASDDTAKKRLVKIASWLAAGKTISESVAAAGITGETATALTAKIASVAVRTKEKKKKTAGPFRRIANNIRSRRAGRMAQRQPIQAATPTAPAAKPVAPNPVAPNPVAIRVAQPSAPTPTTPAAKSVAPTLVAKSVATPPTDKLVAPPAAPAAKSVTPPVSGSIGNSAKQLANSAAESSETYDQAFDKAFNTGRESLPTNYDAAFDAVFNAPNPTSLQGIGARAGLLAGSPSPQLGALAGQLAGNPFAQLGARAGQLAGSPAPSAMPQALQTAARGKPTSLPGYDVSPAAAFGPTSQLQAMPSAAPFQQVSKPDWAPVNEDLAGL
mgnify:FL=1